RDVRIPELTITPKGNTLNYQYSNVVTDFAMPVKITVDGKEQWITPTDNMQSLKVKSKDPIVVVDRNFYVKSAVRSN
ncbi:MAG: M1 family peptidase, partial [Nonlabens sp.]|nr:M1 family peptidase [Nonlabens sp.]